MVQRLFHSRQLSRLMGNDISKRMTTQQIAEAESIAQNCKVSNYSHCDVGDRTFGDSASDLQRDDPNPLPSQLSLEQFEE
jgi:hypothetical protein